MSFPKRFAVLALTVAALTLGGAPVRPCLSGAHPGERWRHRSGPGKRHGIDSFWVVRGGNAARIPGTFSVSLLSATSNSAREWPRGRLRA